MEQKQKERKFLEQLLDGKKVENYTIPVPIKAELRKYQQVRKHFCSILMYIGKNIKSFQWMENRRTMTAAESYNHGQKSWGTFAFIELFFFIHKKPLPHPTNNVGRVYREFFSECQHCVGWGEGKLQENVEKDAQLMFCNGTQKLQKIMSATSLSQGLLCRILVEFFVCVILPLDF